MAGSGSLRLGAMLALGLILASLPAAEVGAAAGTKLPAPPPAQAAEPFGEEVTLAEQSFVYMQGSGHWESAYETLMEALKNVQILLQRRGLEAAGAPITVYTGSDDSTFQFRIGIPVAGPIDNPPRGDIAVGATPAGKALKFVHRGTYDTIDATYEAIANYLDERNLDAGDIFVEQYVNDPLTTPSGDLVINIFVPLQ